MTKPLKFQKALEDALFEYLQLSLEQIIAAIPELSKNFDRYKVERKIENGSVVSFNFGEGDSTSKLMLLDKFIKIPSLAPEPLIENSSIQNALKLLAKSSIEEDKKNQSRLLVETIDNSTLFYECLINFNGLNPQKSILKKFAADTANFIATGRMSMKTLFPIFGLKGTRETNITFDDKVKLTAFDNSHLRKLFERQGSAIVNHDQALPYYQYTFEIIQEICLFEATPGEDNSDHNLYETVEKVTRVLNTLLDGPISAKAKYSIPESKGYLGLSGHFHGFGSGSYRPKDYELYANIDECSDKDITHTYTVYNQLGNDDWLDTVTRRIEIASNRESQIDRLLDSVICLEMIFFARDEKSSNVELKNRVAKVIGKNLNERLTIFDKLSRIISIRNSIVHDSINVKKKLEKFSSEYNCEPDKLALTLAKAGLKYRLRWHQRENSWPTKNDFHSLVLS